MRGSAIISAIAAIGMVGSCAAMAVAYVDPSWLHDAVTQYAATSPDDAVADDDTAEGDDAAGGDDDAAASDESSDDSADADDSADDDDASDDAADDADADDTETITYPPYPGGISEGEYWTYVRDMTTETEIQSAHEGMWQIADCLPMGTSTDGQSPLDEAIGILANQVDGAWVPDPQSGLYCVTRQGQGEMYVGVAAYDTFIRLSREEIDLEPQVKYTRLSRYWS